MRTRTLDERTPSGYIVYDGFSSYGPFTNRAQVPNSIGRIKTIDDELNPNWRARIAAGEIVTGQMRSVTSARSVDRGSYTCSAYGHQYTISGDYAHYVAQRVPIPAPLVLSFSLDDLEKAAVHDAYSKINPTVIDLCENAREFRGLIGLAKGRVDQILFHVKRLVRSYRNYRRWLLKSLAKSFGKISARKRLNYHRQRQIRIQLALDNAWLEHRYAIMPLIMDLSEVLTNEKLTRIMSRPTRFVVKGKAAYTIDSSNRYSLSSGFGDVRSGSCSVVRVANMSAVVRIFCEVRSINAAMETLDASSLSLRSIPTNILNAIPLSFVADWFINLSGFLDSIFVTPSVTVIGSNVSRYSEEALWHKQIELDVDTNHGSTVKMYPGDSASVTVLKERSRNPAIPTLPSFNFKVLKAVQMTTSAALISQRISKLLRDVRR